MDNNLNTLGTDLQEILGDLEPTVPEATTPEEKPVENPVTPTLPVDKIIRGLQEVQRLSQELLSLLQNSEAHNFSSVPNFSRPNFTAPESNFSDNSQNGLGKILEGRFSGEKMIGDDGHEYNVPPNYASKSKLVTGDRMKLTITHNGAFIYKQIGPIERKRVIGALNFDSEHNRWTVESPEGTYRVLPASISFYKGKPGDEVILFVPEQAGAEWGAVDQLIAK